MHVFKSQKLMLAVMAFSIFAVFAYVWLFAYIS